jgi:hypothetical protein
MEDWGQERWDLQTGRKTGEKLTLKILGSSHLSTHSFTAGSANDRVTPVAAESHARTQMSSPGQKPGGTPRACGCCRRAFGVVSPCGLGRRRGPCRDLAGRKRPTSGSRAMGKRVYFTPHHVFHWVEHQLPSFGQARHRGRQ